jgi:hypothetical protein
MITAVRCRCGEIQELWDEDAKSYTDHHVAPVSVAASGWEAVYRCEETGARWVEDYPRSEEHGGGPIRLRRHDGWPPDAPLPHGARVRQRSTGLTGTLVGQTESGSGEWEWALRMDDDERVPMVGNADTQLLS